MRRTLSALGVVTTGVLVASLVAPPAAQGAAGAHPTEASSRTVATAPRAPQEPPPFEPSIGVTFNSPTGRPASRLILHQVIGSIKNTEPGEQIRIATWNFDDTPAAEALIAAAERGVAVQVVVSDRVTSETWATVRRALNQDDRADTFAVQCRGGCRSSSKIMHSKIYLFSRVGTTSNISMVSSSNLTKFAAARQWNDLITTKAPRVYDFLGRIFDESARDRPVANPSEAHTLGDYRVWAFPVNDTNPQLNQLEQVRCHGATGGTGTRDGRTRIRIAVAGWFDAYGQDIADRLRVLWDRGCDVKIVTTLAGRGINQTLKARTGRGPVPIRQLSWDGNGDGVPDKYLHQKSMAISGVFGGDTSASVVLTGSPNWSSRAARSEETWVRLVERPGIARDYIRHVDQLFVSRFSSARLSTRADLRRALAVHARVSGQGYPEWLELD